VQDFELSRSSLPAAARRAVAEVCRDASIGPECLDAAVLMTSEVVTNALRHGQGDVRLAVGADHALVRVEVGDDAPTRPVPRSADTDAESGRGLLIVDALASDWGVLQAAPGKTVWFEVPARP
jgi:anti-sigma regulatory factor (Ser/Thr protein kinase)